MQVSAPGQVIIQRKREDAQDLIQRGDNVKIYKRNHEKEIISFLFSGVQQRVVLKICYVKGNRIQKFFRRWEKSLCVKEFNMAHRFLKQGFAVPAPIYCGEKRRFGLLQSGYYLSYEITDSILLTEYLDQFDRKDGGGKIKEKRKILRDLGRYIGQMHANSMYHGILMPHHVMLKKQSGVYQIYLIDLEYSRICKRPKRRILFKDLRKLNKYTKDYHEEGCLTRTDKLRFVKEYCMANPQLNLSDFTNGFFS